MKFKFILSILLVIITSALNGQNTEIHGIITDSITGDPLSYVTVSLEGTALGSVTDSDGRFSFTSTSRAHTLSVYIWDMPKRRSRLSRDKPIDCR